MSDHTSCAIIANVASGSRIQPTWFALDASRGLDEHGLKVYMRATVLISEYLTYIWLTILFLRRYIRQQHVDLWDSNIALVAILMQPATLLIDHGHFQYNTVMLGFAVACMANLVQENYARACIDFVACLSFKQMGLFYAPAVFAYLLGSCFSFPRIHVARFLQIALTTVVTFAVVFAPLILGSLYDARKGTAPLDAPQPPLLRALPFYIDEKAWFYPPILQLAQAIHRIFPFARGIFEDKVANIWCAIHTFHKLHVYNSSAVQRLALAATTTAIIPPCTILLIRPRKELILWGFSSVAWAFFLCSYQVHEKNVLLPLLPMTLLLTGKNGLSPATRGWVGFSNLVGTWTLFPLLKRDELRVPYFVLTLLWAYLLGLPPTSLSAYTSKERGGLSLFSKVLHLSFYFIMIAWHIAEAFVEPPHGKPDLWVVGNVLLGAAGFGICYMWCLWSLVRRSGLLGVEFKSTVA
jgi:alpha-1,3-glucosyltransferase